MGDMEEVHIWSGNRSSYEPMMDNRPVRLCICSRKRVILGVAVTTLIFFAVVTGLAVSLAAAQAQECKPQPPAVATTTTTTTEAPHTNGTTTSPTTPSPTPVTPIAFAYRLPANAVIVESYALDLTVEDLASEMFKGHVEVTLKAGLAASFVVMHCGTNMTVDGWSVEDFNRTVLGRSGDNAMERDLSVEQIGLHLSESLEVGKQYFINMNYTAAFDPTLRGFYKSTYKGQVILSTQFESTYARRAFPCFDEPDLKANFGVTITHPDTLTAVLSNGEVLSPKTRQGAGAAAMVTTEFDNTPKMSTYLVAFVVAGNLTSVTHLYTGDAHNNVTVSVRAPIPESEKHQLDYALTVTVSLLQRYESYFNESYPLPKLDLVAIPDFSAGAMENWGLILYRMVDLLYDNTTASAANQRRVTSVVAHELAHQWFGNLVSMEWWDALWLNEGMATFIEYNIGMAHIFPPDADSWNMPAYFSLTVLERALQADSLPASHPIVKPSPPATNEEIEAMFDSITYSKGAALIRMLEGAIGHAVLQEGLRSYIQKYKYGNTQTSMLWQCIQEAQPANTNYNVSVLMDHWTTQSGYPLITATLDENNITTVSQSVYSIQPKPTARQWIVPLTYMWQNSTNVSMDSTILTETSGALDLPGDFGWVKLNARQSGVYRAVYDEPLWTRIHGALSKGEPWIIETADRVGLISDAMEMLRTDQPNAADHFVQLCAHLVNDTDYEPLVAATKSLDLVMLLVNDLDGNLSSTAKEFFSAIFEPYLSGFDLDTLDTHSAPDRSLLGLLVETFVQFDCELPEAIDTFINETFRAWRGSPSIPVPVDVRAATYMYGVRHGDGTVWEFMFSYLNRTGSPAETMDVIKALGTTGDPATMDTLLRETISDSGYIKKQDVGYVLACVAFNGHPAGKQLVVSHIITNYDRLRKLVSGFQWRSLLKIFSIFHSEVDVIRNDNFLSLKYEQQALGSAANAAVNARALLQSNKQLVLRQAAPLEAAFREAMP